nr:MAG TPA: hypothetical protein [Caudoviricetes sp.]
MYHYVNYKRGQKYLENIFKSSKSIYLCKKIIQ